MKSVAKKFFAVLLCAALYSTLAFGAVAETYPTDQEGSFNKLGPTEYYFNINKEQTWEHGKTNDYFRTNNTTNYSFEQVPETNGEWPYLRITQNDGGKNLALFPYNKERDNTATFNRMHISFALKIVAQTDTTNCTLCFRYIPAAGTDTATDYATVLDFLNGDIKLLDKVVGTYERGQWYDFDVHVDLQLKLAVLRWKKSDDSIWQTAYKSNFKTLPLYGGSTTVSMEKANMISLSMKAQEAGTEVCLTKYMQNTYDGSLTLISDDFSASNEEHKAHYKWGNAAGKNDAYSQSTSKDTDSLNGVWIFQNQGSTFTTEHVPYGDDYAAKISQTGVQSQIMKLPFNASGNEPDVARQRIRFKTAGNVTPNTDGEQGAINFGIYTRELKEESTHSGLVRILGNDLQIQKADDRYQGVISDMQEEPLQLYDVEIVYDKNSHQIETAVVDGSGVQHVQSRELSADAKGISRFTIAGNSIHAGGTGVRYLDDFSWEFLSERADSDSVTADIASKDAQNALLDESIIVSADETLNLPKCLESVTVKNADEPMEKGRDYTLKQKDGKLYIDFVDLEPETEYNISIDGIALMGGEEINGVTASFTTTGKNVSAIVPVLNGSNIETTVSAPYANGKPVLLIAALYKDDQLIEVLMKEGTAASESKTLSVSRADFKKLGEGTKIRAFVWNNFADMIPYSGAADIAVK